MGIFCKRRWWGEGPKHPADSSSQFQHQPLERQCDNLVMAAMLHVFRPFGAGGFLDLHFHFWMARCVHFELLCAKYYYSKTGLIRQQSQQSQVDVIITPAIASGGRGAIKQSEDFQNLEPTD